MSNIDAMIKELNEAFWPESAKRKVDTLTHKLKIARDALESIKVVAAGLRFLN